ncbi:MAG: hypothetical protein R3C11_21955 [Planctomycetaceae bacterium]
MAKKTSKKKTSKKIGAKSKGKPQPAPTANLVQGDSFGVLTGLFPCNIFQPPQVPAGTDLYPQAMALVGVKALGNETCRFKIELTVTSGNQLVMRSVSETDVNPGEAVELTLSGTHINPIVGNYTLRAELSSRELFPPGSTAPCTRSNAGTKRSESGSAEGSLNRFVSSASTQLYEENIYPTGGKKVSRLSGSN